MYWLLVKMTIHDSIIESILYRFQKGEECYGKTSFETMW